MIFHTYIKRAIARALTVLFLFLPIPISAATLGPVSSFSELRTLILSAHDGDVIMISGALNAHSEPALTSNVHVRITSAPDNSASISNLRIVNGDITLSNLTLEDSLQISGTSNVLLTRGTSVTGAEGASGISFNGNGMLILEPGSVVTGGSSSSGVFIAHQAGDFFASLEGKVIGGNGTTGGTGVVVSPLRSAGAVMISGNVTGGQGTSLGGHALNLYELSGNAYVTVDGKLQGGSGSIGGDGIHLVSAAGNTVVGIAGTVKGGRGESYGGDALILMNASDSSSFHLSGSFSGGDTIGADTQPGTSLTLVGHAASLRTFVGDCFLEDGKQLDDEYFNPLPVVTPLPSISSVDEVEHLDEITDSSALAPDIPPFLPSPENTPVPEADDDEISAPHPSTFPDTESESSFAESSSSDSDALSSVKMEETPADSSENEDALS